MPVSVVTGGAGFLGSFMVDLLVAKGHEVRVMDTFEKGRTSYLDRYIDSGMWFINGSINGIHPEHKIYEGVNYIFHFAGLPEKGPSFQFPAEYMLVNGYGTVSVLEAARKNKSKVIYAMTSAVYGETVTPCDEQYPILEVFEHPYALSKLWGEQALWQWGKNFGVKGNSIRIINAYGERVRAASEGGAVFPIFFKAKLAGKPIPIMGDGEQRRDFIYAADVCTAFLLAAESDISGEIWNLGGGDPQSINHLADLVGGPREYIPARNYEPKVTWSDNSKIERDLGWKKQHDFDATVRRMLENIEEWRDAA